MTGFFSATYSEARQAFLDAACAAGAAIDSHRHPERGAEGEELATDIARLGPAAPRRVLFTMSATHGVEGFCGSGVQTGALRSGLYRRLPGDTAVVLIHAINPWGFSWLARTTHENVDLNRNHVDHDAPRPANEGYRQLQAAICPEAWDEEARHTAQAALDAYGRQHGAMALQQAVSGGQYSHPQGVFFGGHAPCWSAGVLAATVARHAAGARQLAFIDYHTGLGPYGHGEIISDHMLADPGHARLEAWLGAAEVTSTDDGSSVSAPLTGTNSACVARAAPQAALTMATPEFGTYSTAEVLDSLRADCWLARRGDPRSARGRAIKAEIRRCFYPDADDWKAMVWERACDIERRFMAGLASLDPAAAQAPG